MAELQRVVVRGTGSFLPNEPVPNDRIDDVLGPLSQAAPRVQSFVKSVGQRMLEAGGVKSRHFAVDPETHKLTHTVAGLAEPACRAALDMGGCKPQDVDLLLLSSPNFDHSTPPTTTVLQERLGLERCAEIEVHSNCAGVGKAMQIAYDSLRVGRYRTALVVYSQLSSVYLRSCYFHQAHATKTQAALRYILADGAGAVLLSAVPSGNAAPQRELLGTYIESVGGLRAPGMTAGGGVADLVGVVNPAAVFEQATHHLDQDFAAVNRDAGPLLLEGVKRMLTSLSLDPRTVDHFIWSIPTMQLYHENAERFTTQLGVSTDRMRFRAAKTGYCGGAAVLIHFDEMARSGEIQDGQTVVLHSVESSKWMSGGFVVRW
ncbi:MAG: 3-oxoacyl-ACP synthase III family protein [Phycisphaerae bacterium]